MVSTRGVKYKFCENEKVLCYEPDQTKTKVLYDSKVLEVIELKDKRGRKIVEYLIHFQGWNPSWDRRVGEDFVLKDTEKNRQLQRDLANKSQLQLGTFLYRKERKNRTREMNQNLMDKVRVRESSEEGSSESRDYSTVEDNESESNGSSAETLLDEKRVVFRLGQKLKEYLDYDYKMIKSNKLTNQPSKMSVIKILENFVKHHSIRSICLPKSPETRKRRNQFRAETKAKNFENLTNSIELCKEVADGLRIYFDFTLKDYLLYNQEKDQARVLLSEKNLTNFTYISSGKVSLDNFQLKQESPITPVSEVVNESQVSCSDISESKRPGFSRRRLRSYNKIEDNEFVLDVGAIKQENCVSSIASTSSDSSTPHTNCNTSNMNILRSILPLNIGITVESREMLQNVLSWELIPSNSSPEPSMIYGAIHLSRLIVKLPEFLNATTMPDDRLKVLLKHLDSFIEYLEEHSEWFGEHNYKTISS